LVNAYRKDFDNSENKEPLRLLMGYAFAIDHAGHGDGPESEGTTKAVHEVDQALAKTVGEVADIFKQHMHPDQGDTLYVLITTDHGMDTIKMLVNLKWLMGRADVPSPDPVRAEWAGSIANIYLNDVPGAEREAVKKSILDNLRKASYLKCWTRDELPQKWEYGNPTRTGEIVVSLNPGYYFTKNDVAAPVPAESEPRALKGMHGYDPEMDDKMLGFMVFSRWGSDQPGHDLGPISTLRLHPTVAKLLGINPAAGAKAAPIDLPQ
jgi:predicted AlkP superfamily pyrophosphatase or phosphodiesterase